MGPALQAAFLVMQDYGGKLLLFQSAVPSLGARPNRPCSCPLLPLLPVELQPNRVTAAPELRSCRRAKASGPKP